MTRDIPSDMAVVGKLRNGSLDKAAYAEACLYVKETGRQIVVLPLGVYTAVSSGGGNFFCLIDQHGTHSHLAVCLTDLEVKHYFLYAAEELLSIQDKYVEVGMDFQAIMR